MNIKETFKNKTLGFYLGAVGSVLALIAGFMYIGMNSYSFTPWIFILILLGIITFFVAQLFKVRPVNALAYIFYLVAFGIFFRTEIENNMDTIVDPQQGLGAVTPLFFLFIAFALIAVGLTIAASVMKCDKKAEVEEVK